MPEPPRRRFGVLAHEMQAGDLVADAAAAARAGVDGMSVGTRELERRGTAEVGRVFADAGLAVSSVGAIGPSLTCEHGGAIDGELEVLEASAALAAPGVIALTGPLGTLSARDADTRCRRWLERVAPRAAELGTTVMLEPVFPMMRSYTYVHTLSHAFELVADLDGAGVVVDIGHVWWDPRLLEQFRVHVDDIGTVQLTNMSSHALDRLRYSRAALDEGEVPLRELVLDFDAAGYRGWYEHEVLTKEPTDRVQFVRAARAWFDAVWG
jgi:sugar phosphate isomerase/epimerase